ncbi:MAG: MMPL family transporter [Candidatus Altiarchaeota archaeon]
MSLEKHLKKLARFQYEHHLMIVVVSLIITVYMAQGLGNVYMETDFAKMMPQDVPVFKNSEKVSSRFGGSDLVLVVVELDHGSDIKDKPQDIRDPRIMRMLGELQTQLAAEPKIDRVLSAGSFFPYGVPQTLTGVKTVLSAIPGSDGMFNKDYSITMLYIYTNVGGGSRAVTSFTRIIEDNIENVAKPPGVELTITGGPPIGKTIAEILWSDAIYTTLLAAAIILVLLAILQKSIYKGVLIFIPLLLGLTWTLGAMGHLDIPLSVATVAVGAMILGLGVEYGVFVVERYMEEREGKGKSPAESIEVAVPGVGSAILGSGITTMVGFGSLRLGIMPMMQDLGTTLALGIASCLLVSLLVNPAFIILGGRITGFGGRER